MLERNEEVLLPTTAPDKVLKKKTDHSFPVVRYKITQVEARMKEEEK